MRFSKPAVVRLGRRGFLFGAATAALTVGLGVTPAHAATALTYTLAYNGDFTTPAAAFAGIGTNLTQTRSNVTGVGSTSTTVVLDTSVGDYTGLVITIGAESKLIAKASGATYNLVAAAGYTGTWSSTPGTGASYAIAAVSVFIQQGQGSAGVNEWTVSGAQTISGITTSVASYLTVGGATPWDNGALLNNNAAGDTGQPVAMVSSGGLGSFDFILTVSGVANVTVQDLQLINPTVGGGGAFTTTASTTVCKRLWFQAKAVNDYQWVSYFSGSGSVAQQCVSVQENTSGDPRNVLFVGDVTLYGCTGFGGGSAIAGWAGTITAIGCAFFNQAVGVIWAGGANVVVITASAADQAATGITVLTLAGLFLSPSFGAGLDLRPAPGSALINNAAAGTNANNLLDIYGATRSLTHATFGAAEVAFVAPSTMAVSWSVNYAGDVPNMDSSFQGTGGVTGGTLTIATVTAGAVQVGDIVMQTWAKMSVITGLGSGTGGVGTYTVATQVGGYSPVDTGPTDLRVDPLMRVTGPNLNYYQTGKTCGGTAANATHIVLSGATSACVGHPVQWSGQTGIIGSFVLATQTAALRTAPAGSSFVSTFSGTPQAGDAYTISPTTVEFVIGAFASGGGTPRLWDLVANPINNSNLGGISLACAGAGTTNTVTLRGQWGQDSAVAVGTMTGGNAGSPVIASGGNHVTVIFLGMPGARAQVVDLQVHCQDLVHEENACFDAGVIGAQFDLLRVAARGDSWTHDTDHMAIVNNGSPGSTATNCVFIGADYRQRQICGQLTLIHTSVFGTNNAVGVVGPGSAASGQAVIPLTSTAAVQAPTGGANFGMWTGGPAADFVAPSNNPNGTNSVLSKTGSAVTINDNLAATIAAGTPLYFGNGSSMIFGSNTATALTNSLFAGAATVWYVQSSNPPTVANCATDLPGVANTTQFNYPTLFPHMSGQITTALDARQAAAVPTVARLVSVTTDFFGNPRSATTAIGAIENAPANNNGGLMMRGVG